jgi:hypothetical protein
VPSATDRLIAGRYALGAHIGSGGFGAVYEAWDRLSGRLVAVKLLGIQSERELQRFRYETTSLRLLQVPGVVRLLDDGVDGGEAFIVMERLVGEYFPDGPIPTRWEHIVGPTIGMLEAVARVHAIGVIHRDLKPSNVIINAEGRVTVLDFGVSALRDVTPRKGEVIGTPSYLAPEQAIGATVDARADLYSVGVMLFEALSGRLPHEAKTGRELIQAKINQRAPLLRSFAPEVAPEIAEIVDWLLEPLPDDRPASASVVIDELLGRQFDDPIARRLDELARDGEITVERLGTLFLGPDLFVHIPTDAAELAIERAGTRVESLANELGAWVRAGLARCEGGALAIDRASLHRIATLANRRHAGADVGAVGAAARELLVWIALAGPTVPSATIATVAGVSEVEFAQLAAELLAAGLIREAGVGFVADASAVAGTWSPERVRRAHCTLFGAIAPGNPGRMLQALHASDAALIVDDLEPFVEASIRDGYLERARAVIAEAVHILRRAGELTALERALAALAELALTEATMPAYDQLLIELGTIHPRTPAIERLSRLAKAGVLSEEGDIDRAQALLAEVGPLSPPRFELRRHACRLRASRYSGDAFVANLAAARQWASTAPAPASAHLQAWEARAHYRAGRFAEAANGFLTAAEAMESAVARMLERLNAAAAMLETYADFDAAIEQAELARQQAVVLRHPLAEARAFWVLRAAHYRRGEDLTPDFAAASAATAIGVPWQAALIVFGEAAFAWRARHSRAAELFGQALELTAVGGQVAMRALCGLAQAIAGEAEFASLAQLDQAMAVAEHGATPPGVAVQLSALSARLGADLAPRAAAVCAKACAAIPTEQHAMRRELLSVSECLA